MDRAVADPRRAGAAVARALLRLRAQLKLLHWQTRSYAHHKALDWLLERLEPLVDRWVETFQGLHGRVRLGGCLDVWDSRGRGATREVLREERHRLGRLQARHFRADPDLCNVGDEIMSALARAEYLLTLR